MAVSDFEVKAIVSADTRNFDKGMKQAQTSANNLSNTFGNLSKIITKALSFAGLAVGTKAIVDFSKSSVQSATQAIKQFDILDNTIRATGADAWTSTKEMEDLSKSLSDSSNYSVTEIQKMQSVLLGFRDVTGDTFEDASNAVLDMATVMGMDLTSAVQTVGKALDDPIKGLDSLRRQGFQFTDEQKAELAQLVKTGNKMEAQKIILDELARSYGGASKAGQDAFAKQRHAVENLKDSLGTKLIPIVKVFAEDNAKMLNSLRELIEKTDFTPVVNILTNLKSTFSEVFGVIASRVKEIGGEIQDFISRFNFAPVVSLLDTLIGVVAGVINKFKELNSQRMDFLDKFKEALISISNSDTFKKIVDYINKVIDVFFFLWEQIQDIFEDIRKIIVDKIIEIWGKVKEIFENSQTALENSAQDIASWGEFFWKILDNVYRIFQDLINGVKAILSGDWEVAWGYAKLAVMHVADSILKMVSTIANAFPELVNGMVKALNELIKGVNTVRGWLGLDPFGLIDAFESIDLTKKTGLDKKIQDAENRIKELTGHVADNSIESLEGVSAHFAGFTHNALGLIEDLTEGTEKETKKQKQYFSDVASEGESSYKAFSEWDSKLLQQRLENLDEWSDEYLEINTQLIEANRQKAHEADKEGKETVKIDEYYNNEILKAYKKTEEAKRAHAKETFEKVTGYLKSVASTTVNVLKNIVSKTKNIISSIGSIFTTLFEFNPDEALDNLLKFEDSVLTFFVETLPKLPSFFGSAVQSISVLIQNVLSLLDFEAIGNILDSIISTIGKLITTVAQFISENSQKFSEGIITILKSVIGAVVDWIQSGGWKAVLDAILDIQKALENVVVEILPELVDTIISLLPDLIDTLIESIVSASKTLGKLFKPILTLVIKLIEAIIDIAFSDEVIDASMGVIEDFIEALIEVLIEVVIQVLPKVLPKVISKLIRVAVRSLASFPIEIAKAFVNGLVKALIDTDWKKAVKDMFQGFIDGFKNLFGIHSPSTLFESFGINMMEGLWNGLSQMKDMIIGFFSNLWSGIQNVFSNVGDWFKNTFDSIGNWFSGVFNNLSNWFSDFVTNAQNAIGNIGQKVKEAGQKVSQSVSSGGLTGSTAGDIGLAFATGGWSLLGNLFKHANGTDNAPRGLSLVGEAGPELVRFNGGEQVLNAHNTQKALANAGGKNITNNITFNNLKDTTAYAMMQQMKQYNRQMAINGII